MNDGMKLILKRMQTNPEEFETKEKWRRLVEHDWPIFTEEEQKAYSSGLREILLDRFSETVIKTLMEDQNETLKYKMAGRYAVGWDDGGILKLVEESMQQAQNKMQDAITKELYK